MKQCPFCDRDSKQKFLGMEPVSPVTALEALGLDMESALGAMLKRALNPKGRVYRCPSCGFIAIFCLS